MLHRAPAEALDLLLGEPADGQFVFCFGASLISRLNLEVMLYRVLAEASDLLLGQSKDGQRV